MGTVAEIGNGCGNGCGKKKIEKPFSGCILPLFLLRLKHNNLKNKEHGK